MSHIELHQAQYRKREAEMRNAARQIIGIQQQITKLNAQISEMRVRVKVLQDLRAQHYKVLGQGFQAINEVEGVD